ncbi:TPA: gp53-like domain-containing protein [Providencia alcalifaciens]
MQDLMPPIDTQDSIFHDGDPTTGQLGTIVTASWLNNVQAATRDVQAEIKNVLAKAGMTPDPKKNNQLADAISQIVTSGNYASTAYVDNGLNKKIDKANISGVKGNDNDKVPSLNLFTTEIGKLQPKGNYQPEGDYATNTALTNGIALKFDKTGGTITGKTTVKTTGAAISIQPVESDAVHYELSNQDGTRGGYFGFGSAANPTYLQLINDRDSTSVAIYGGKIYVNNRAALTTNDISQSTGSSTSSIMSQNAATTELNKKFNTSGGDVSGVVNASGNITSNNGIVISKYGSTILEVNSRTEGQPHINVSVDGGNTWLNQLFQLKKGTLGHINRAATTESGYLICGDTGIIIQWGIVSGSTSTSDYRQFPIPFKSACFQIVASYAEFGDNGMSTACYPTSKSEFIITKRSSTGALTSGNVRYIAVGY